MLLSRQVLSSPFDVKQRPRERASTKGNRVKVKEKGSSLVAPRNVDDTEPDSVDQQPESTLFDSRLIKNDIFANPIVTVKGQPQQHKDQSQSRQKKNDSTPPPVKGRAHISIQTDDYDDTDAIASKRN